jgi:hypothetical protein
MAIKRRKNRAMKSYQNALALSNLQVIGKTMLVRNKRLLEGLSLLARGEMESLAPAIPFHVNSL